MSVSEQTSEQEHMQETKSFVRTNDIPCLKRVARKFWVVAVQQQRQKKYIYIYIYTRFQKGFHIERYIDRYILLFSCTCARVHFSFAIVQLVKNLGSTINFFFVGFFVPI